MSTQISADRPYALPAGAGTRGRRGPWHPAVGKPGEEPPLHVHKNTDEWFYLIEGAVTFHVGGENLYGEAGAFVSLPRGIPHTFSVETPSAHFLVINTPGGFERMFELAPKMH